MKITYRDIIGPIVIFFVGVLLGIVIITFVGCTNPVEREPDYDRALQATVIAFEEVFWLVTDKCYDRLQSYKVVDKLGDMCSDVDVKKGNVLNGCHSISKYRIWIKPDLEWWQKEAKYSHELIHAVFGCEMLDYDGDHDIPLGWERNDGKKSVEYKAKQML